MRSRALQPRPSTGKIHTSSKKAAAAGTRGAGEEPKQADAERVGSWGYRMVCKNKLSLRVL